MIPLSASPVIRILTACAAALLLSTGLEATDLSRRHRPDNSPRVVFIKADGLPIDLMAAVATERPEYFARLHYAEKLRESMDEYKRRTGRTSIMPNVRRFFFEDGVVFDNIYSHTLTLSAVAWGVIDTGQPSVAKGHGTFSRDTCYLRSHLDGLRDTWDALMTRPGHGEFKTSATWLVEQAGVNFMLDAFDPMRVWSGPQIYRREASVGLLAQGGLRWLTADGDSPLEIAHGHLSRMVTGLDYPEFNQEMNALVAGQRILDPDYTGGERYDYISPFFTIMDHQQHVDPHPTNLVHYLSKLDWALGIIFEAVARSDRRDETLVVLTSDHGSEIKPGETGFSFPISKVFREPLFGSHNVRTLLVENAWSAITTPMPGYDWPRLYTSKTSPYQGGYTTAFLDPFGNGRAAVHLRNNDLNRLHLILLELQKKDPSTERFSRLRSLFKKALDDTRKWLEPDLALYEDYYIGTQDLVLNLRKRNDRQSRDTAGRLESELEKNAPQIRALKNLLGLAFETGQEGVFFDDAFRRSFEISDYIPKEFLGLPNSLYQLSHYTVALDEDLNWVETTVDHQGRPVQMNYFDILADYRAANAPANGLANPYDFTAAPVPVSSARTALEKFGLVEEKDEIRNVVWVKSVQQPTEHKGGEALLIDTVDHRIQYVPVKNLRQHADGSMEFELAEDIDPLSILRGDGFAEDVAGMPRLNWLRTFHPWREWIPVIKDTEYSSAPIVLLDVINNFVTGVVDNPEFQERLLLFSSDSMKHRYLRGLKRKYANQNPDFLIFSDELWNFNSKARTAGGNHSGLRPITTRTVFVVWGGDETGIARGRVIQEPCSTIDIAPTVLNAMGMLGKDNRVIKAPGADPNRIFVPFYGKAIDLRLPAAGGGLVAGGSPD